MQQQEYSNTPTKSKPSWRDQRPLTVALRRSDAFKEEISKVDHLTAKQLIAAWKETIAEQFMTALRETQDPQALTVLDTQAAMVIEVSRGIFQRRRKHDDGNKQ